MNKNKIIMASIGGVALLAVLAFAFLSWNCWEEKTELEDDLDTARTNVQRIKGNDIAPEQKSIDAIKANAKAYDGWRDTAKEIVSQGDREEDPAMTPEAFKQKIMSEWRELSELKIANEGFDFGFKQYIVDGAMPEKATLAFLQRQWAEVVSFAKALHAAGAAELVAVTVHEREAPKAEEKPKSGKKGAKGKKKGVAEEKAEDATTCQSYDLKFLARPSAFVKFMNALDSDKRFTVVDDFTISRQTDQIGQLFGASKTESAAAQGGGRRRSRRSAEQPEAAQAVESENAKRGLVFDPMHEGPLTVSVKITTYDFGAKKSSAAEAKEEEE